MADHVESHRRDQEVPWHVVVGPFGVTMLCLLVLLLVGVGVWLAQLGVPD